MVKRKTEDLGHPDYHWDTSEYPPTAIPLISMDKLPPLEDNMVGSVKLDITPSQWTDWSYRDPLEKIIRPDGVYSEIIDPYFAMMEQPYQEMLEALEDPAKSFVQGYALQERSLRNEQFLESAQKCMGFQFFGQIKKQDCPISAQVWYMNAPMGAGKSGSSLRSNQHGGIIRIIAIPFEQREVIQKATRKGKLSTAVVGRYVAKPNGGKTSRKPTLG